MKLKPTLDNVVIKLERSTQEDSHGLMVVRTKPMTIGKVVSVGDGHWEHGVRIRPDVEAGNRVVLQWEPRSGFTINGDDIVVVEASEIIAIIED